MGVSCVYQELSIAPQLDVAKNLFIGNLPMKAGWWITRPSTAGRRRSSPSWI